MASKKDMRREDLIVPFFEPEANKDDSNMSGTLAQTMPMAALFTRNKMIAWVSVVFSLQTWLAESPAQVKASGGTPGYFNVGLGMMALVVTYLPLFMPPTAQGPRGTQASAAAPPAHA